MNLLLQNNPYLTEVLTWNKKENKIRNLFGVLKKIRRNKYDLAINVQRFCYRFVNCLFWCGKNNWI